RLFYTWIAVSNAARAGAQYGSQTLTNAADTNGMRLAATTDGSNITGLTATASQCTCVSGTSVAVCSGSNYNCTNAPKATYVKVYTKETFNTKVTYPGVPSSHTVNETAIIQAAG